MSALKYGLIGGGIVDMGLALLSFVNPSKLTSIVRVWKGEDKYVRMVGTFMLICGIARLHGGLNFGEKGAYRVCLWSFIVEFGYHALEVYNGSILLKDTIPIFVICATAILFMTISYKKVLYSDKTEKKRG